MARFLRYLATVLHSVVLKNLPACAAKSFPVLLEALLDGIVAICHLLSAKPRRIVRASLLLLRGAGLRSRRATSQNQDGNCYQNDSAHLLLLRDMICDQPTPGRITAYHDLRQARLQALVTQPMRPGLLHVWRAGSAWHRPASLPRDSSATSSARHADPTGRRAPPPCRTRLFRNARASGRTQ
jgi:hypothetical protein